MSFTAKLLLSHLRSYCCIVLILSSVQDFAFAFDPFKEVSIVSFLQLVEVLLKISLALQHIRCFPMCYHL